MADIAFNLLKEPWIQVMRPDGGTQEVFMLELYQRAPEFRGLAGELPTQDVAVLRLLLAVLHAVFARYDLNGSYDPLLSPRSALTRWKALWDAGSFPMEIIRDYLLHYEDRFYLFHPERPFYQVAGLIDNKKSVKYTSAKLNGEIWQSGDDPEAPTKVRLFPQRTGRALNTLSYAEAVRWLLHVNAFDDKSGSGKGRGETKRLTYELGWLGNLGLITAVGRNLFETLLLNFVLLKEGDKEIWGSEKPIWESDIVLTSEGTQVMMPDNPSELLTFQSRRLQLIRDEEVVTGYVLLGGDYFSPDNAFTEQMTLWESDTSKKGSATPLRQPRHHDPSRQLWRDFSALVAQGSGYRRPGIITWLSALRGKGVISYGHFQFETAAIKYKKGNPSSVDNVYSDSLSLNAELLTSLGEAWVSLIINEIGTTDLLINQLGYLAQNIAKAGGGSGKRGGSDGPNPRATAIEQAYFSLDAPFRRWLEEIDPQRDADRKEEICDAWWEQARRIVRNLGRELVEQAGPQAFTGRVLKEKEKEYRYTAPEAYNRFMKQTSTRQALKGGEKKDG